MVREAAVQHVSFSDTEALRNTEHHPDWLRAGIITLAGFRLLSALVFIIRLAQMRNGQVRWGRTPVVGNNRRLSTR